MVHSFEGERPDISRASLRRLERRSPGSVTLGEGASVWYGAALRGDIAAIRVGAGSNVQDGAVLHVDEGLPASSAIT